jgi:hypothetical protein
MFTLPPAGIGSKELLEALEDPNAQIAIGIVMAGLGCVTTALAVCFETSLLCIGTLPALIGVGMILIGSAGRFRQEN